MSPDTFRESSDTNEFRHFQRGERYKCEEVPPEGLAELERFLKVLFGKPESVLAVHLHCPAQYAGNITLVAYVSTPHFQGQTLHKHQGVNIQDNGRHI